MLTKIQEGRKAPSKPKQSSSLEEQKILDRMKELEELQKQHEKKRKDEIID